MNLGALGRLNLSQLTFKFDAISSEPEQDNSSEELGFAIADKGKDGVKYLKTKLDNANDNQLRAIIAVLPYYAENDGDVKTLLQQSLTDKRPLIIAAAIDGLTVMENEKLGDDIKAMLQHESPYVKSSVLHYLAAMQPDLAFPVLIGSLKHSDHIVRQNALDELGELGNAEAIPHIKPFVKDPHQDVRDAAKNALEMLQE